MALLLTAISYQLYTFSQEDACAVQNDTEVYATLKATDYMEDMAQVEEEQMDARLDFMEYIDYE